MISRLACTGKLIRALIPVEAHVARDVLTDKSNAFRDDTVDLCPHLLNIRRIVLRGAAFQSPQ